MKKVMNKIKINIYFWTVLFVLVSIIVQFVLYLFDIRFRLVVIFVILIGTFLGFALGILQQIFSSFDKKMILLKSVGALILWGILFVLFMPFISTRSLISYGYEYITSLDNLKYVALVYEEEYEDIDYYSYYGPLFMGTEVKVHGNFKENDRNPFIDIEHLQDIEYFYYDKGKVTLIKDVQLIRDDEGNIVDYNISTNDFKDTDFFDKSENYLLPEEEEVLYEVSFGDTIIRFGRVDYVLGQNMLVNVLRSPDHGKNFYDVSSSTIQVSNEARFVFLNENLGFALSDGRVLLNSDRGMYVTCDGGETFDEAHFNYQQEGVSYLTVDGLPYLDDGVLKVKALAYYLDKDKDAYQNKELIFVSNDQGLTWSLES